jgi:lipopolysaccharide export system protein LptA
MRLKTKAVSIALAVLISTAAAVPALCAGNAAKPVELSADSIEYDSAQGILTAAGNVKMVQDNAVMTGNHAWYNAKTKEGVVSGNVKAVKGDATLVAEEVHSYDNTHLVATGHPVLTKGEDKLIGPQVDYYTDRQYANVSGGAELTTADGVITAQQIESYFAENKAVAKGNVHINSAPRHLDATADQAVYYGQKGQGKAVLTGNARAVQDGNVLTGNTLTIYLDNKQLDASGRCKLVVVPKSKTQG